MTFTREDEVHIGEACKLLTQIPNAGGEALARMFAAFPGTKSYFQKFGDYKASSDKVIQHGKKVVDALVQASQHLHDLESQLHPLSVKHATELMVDPVNFEHLSHCIHVTIAAHHGEKYTAEMHRSADKFFERVSSQLVSLYR